MLVELLADHGAEVSVPEGAFYMMVPVDENDEAWCEEALTDVHVATTPGSAFGTPGYARVSYAAPRERLQEGVERLVDADYL